MKKPIMVYLDESFKRKIEKKIEASPYPVKMSALIRKLLAEWLEAEV